MNLPNFLQLNICTGGPIHASILGSFILKDMKNNVTTVKCAKCLQIFENLNNRNKKVFDRGNSLNDNWKKSNTI